VSQKNKQTNKRKNKQTNKQKKKHRERERPEKKKKNEEKQKKKKKKKKAKRTHRIRSFMRSTCSFVTGISGRLWLDSSRANQSGRSESLKAYLGKK
jgi:cytoskeletal protein RodZ